MKTIDINLLPADVQASVRDKLTCYDTAYITRENGEYTYTAAVCLDTRKKATDFTMYEIKNSDIYSVEERRANLAELNRSMAAMNVPDSFWN
jgi:hypothetical protein